jgi:hypothetical protein
MHLVLWERVAIMCNMYYYDNLNVQFCKRPSKNIDVNHNPDDVWEWEG